MTAALAAARRLLKRDLSEAGRGSVSSDLIHRAAAVLLCSVCVGVRGRVVVAVVVVLLVLVVVVVIGRVVIVVTTAGFFPRLSCV